MANFQKIIELLQERRLLKKAFCETVGISYPGLSDILDRNSTKTDVLERIAEFFQVPVGYFFDEVDIDGTVCKSRIIGNSKESDARIEKLELEVKHLNELLAEKERLIRVLMDKKVE